MCPCALVSWCWCSKVKLYSCYYMLGIATRELVHHRVSGMIHLIFLMFMLARFLVGSSGVRTPFVLFFVVVCKAHGLEWFPCLSEKGVCVCHFISLKHVGPTRGTGGKRLSLQGCLRVIRGVQRVCPKMVCVIVSLKHIGPVVPRKETPYVARLPKRWR